MRVNAKNRIKWTKVGIILISWIFIAVAITIYDHFMIASVFSKGSSSAYTLERNLAMNLFGAIVGATIGGWFLVYIVNERFRDKPYIYTILAVKFSFFIIVGLITLLMGFFFGWLESEHPMGHPSTTAIITDFIVNPVHIKNILVWGLVTALTQLMLQVNDKFGPGLFWSIATGRYHIPRREKRVFMFLDINGSTTIAEKIGNDAYYNLLRDFFADITNPILYNKGQIYQYVGDEVVVSWPYESGIEHSHCLECYFAMLRKMKAREAHYVSRYGLSPGFKAGIHLGEVTAGEIGIIKRDITYSGDVMNTTARIMNQCNAFGVNLLVSEKLLSSLPQSRHFESRHMGEISLRGKEQKVSLSTIVNSK